MRKKRKNRKKALKKHKQGYKAMRSEDDGKSWDDVKAEWEAANPLE